MNIYFAEAYINIVFVVLTTNLVVSTTKNMNFVLMLIETIFGWCLPQNVVIGIFKCTFQKYKVTFVC